ncbi:MAG: UDP-N-acetylmuramate--alanine ligase, partial [Alteromonas naphthalenivorans]
MSKLRVGVLMGGMSIEREVSFNSGRTICDHLDAHTYDIIPIFQTLNNKLFILPWRFLYRGKISDFEHRLEKETKKITWDDLKNIIDFMYIAVHGRYAEDGTLQGFLEILGISYLGTKVLGSALGMNKTLQKKILTHSNVVTPNSITIEPDHIKENTKDLIVYLQKNNLDFPLIIKPNQEGSSLGISVVFNEQELLPALIKARDVHTEEQQSVLIEEKIEGMEFSCITLFDKITGEPISLPPTEVVIEKGSHIHDYEQKYMPGRAQKFTPARCSNKVLKDIQTICLKTTQALHFTTMSRIDGFVKKDGTIVIIDPNTLSGMAPSSFFFNQAAEIGMSHTDIINHLIETELHTSGLQKTSVKQKNIMNTKKLRVGILLGGTSNEKEISLESGRNIFYKLSSQYYQATPLFVDKKIELYPLTQKLLVHNSTTEIENDLDRSTKITWGSLPEQFDFIFIGLHGGAGENGSVQGTLEMLGLPYNGSGVAASALCMNKFETNKFLAAQGFDVPRNVLISKEEWECNKKNILKSVQIELALPLIAKPHDDGCSTMVEKIKTIKQIELTINEMFKKNKPYVFLEEFIDGMELTVGVIGNNIPQALPPSQTIVSGEVLSIQEKFLPGAGENQTPAPLKKEALGLVQQTVVQGYKALGCSGYARIDCFYQTTKESPTSKERIIILEINTLPGMTPATCIFHQAAEIGIKPMEFIDTIIRLGLEKYGKILTPPKQIL